MEVKKYLERINYGDRTEATVAVLNILQKKHLLSVPFENLDIHYNNPIKLNRPDIYNKVVGGRRGGFCYELNGIFYELLNSIGFDVKMVSARVFNQKHETFSPEFDHLAIITKIDSINYLTDVGFGEFAFTPLKIELSTILHDERGVFRIEKYDEEYYQVSKQADESWIPEYMFTLKARDLNEFRQRCHYNQTSPSSHFTQNKFCSLATEKGRVTVTANKIKITEGDTIIELPVNGEEEFLKALRKYFQIRLNETAQFTSVTPV
jgi:N-hydroxyarylamine O-acetyltransferase